MHQLFSPQSTVTFYMPSSGQLSLSLSLCLANSPWCARQQFGHGRYTTPDSVMGATLLPNLSSNYPSPSYSTSLPPLHKHPLLLSSSIDDMNCKWILGVHPRPMKYLLMGPFEAMHLTSQRPVWLDMKKYFGWQKYDYSTRLTYSTIEAISTSDRCKSAEWIMKNGQWHWHFRCRCT